MQPFIELRGNRYTLDKIQSITPQSSFDEETIGFITDWQNGQESFMQKTSGSTGKPKVTEIGRSQMMASAMMTIKALRLQNYQNSLLCLSPEYIAGKMMIIRSLINKMNIIAVEPSSDPVKNTSTHIDFAALTPMQLQTVLESPESALKANDYGVIILGGAPVSFSLENQIEKLNAACYSTYGMTETVSHIALKKLNGEDKSNYYTCLDEIELNIDERGCLTVNGAVTNFETVITNDLVNLISDKKFEWLGRFDNIINTGGIKVRSEKIEKTIAGLFKQLGIKNRFFIIGLPDEKLGQKITLVIEGHSTIDQKKLIELLTQQVDKYETPRQILYTDKFEETATGKVQRKKSLINATPL